jgi:hypothetical protein
VNDRTTDAADLDALTWASRWGVRSIDLEAFLALPPDKRAVAIARIDALADLTTRNPPPSRAEQKRVAAALNISLPRLQGLMRAWKREKSLSVVVPYLGRKPPSRSTKPAHRIARGVIAKALARHPSIAEPTVSRRIAAICARLRLKPPARMTVRSLLEEARRELPPPALVFPIDAQPETEPYVVAPGDRLVLSMQHFEAAVETPGQEPAIGQALLLFDLFTGLILGVSPDLSLGTLARDVTDTLYRRFEVGAWRRPRTLLLGTDLTPGKTLSLRERAKSLGITTEVVLRQQVQRWIDVILSNGFDHLRPAAQPLRRQTAPGDWPRLSPDEFAYLLQEAVSAQRSAREERHYKESGPRTGGEQQLAAVLAELLEAKG